MIIELNRRIFLAGATAVSLAGPALATGTTHEVEMLNKHPDNKKLRNVFSPRILKIQPGDTVVFKPTDKGHDSASIKDMLPEGTEPWKGKTSKEISVTFEVPGIYGYKCTPHYTTGMAGMIIVEGDGMLDNIEAARNAKHRGKGRKTFDEIWAEVDEMGLLTPAS